MREKILFPWRTQADIQVENIRKGSRRFRIADGILGMIGWLLTIYFFLSLYFDGARTLSDGSGLTLAFTGFMLGVYGSVEFITFRRWYKKAKANARRDQSFTPTKGYPMISKIIMLLTMACCSFLCLYSRRRPGAGRTGRIFYRLLFSGYYQKPYAGRGSATAANIGVNLVLAFLFSLWYLMVITILVLLKRGTIMKKEDFTCRGRKIL